MEQGGKSLLLFFVSISMCVTAPKASCSSRTNDEDKMFEKMVLISTSQVKPHISSCISSSLIYLIPG